MAQPARREQRVAALAVCLSGALLVAQMAAIAWLIEQVLVQQQPLARWWPVLAGLTGVVLLRSGLSALTQWAGGRVADVAKRELRARLYRSVQQRGPLWLRGQRSGEISELMLTHTDALEGHYAGFMPVRTEVMVVPLLMLAVVLWVDWVVALILIGTAPWVPFFMMLVGWGAEAAGRTQLQQMARLSAHFADRLKGLGLLRLYGRGEAELQGVADAADGVQNGTMRVLRIAFLSSTVLEFFASTSVAMVALYFGLSHLGMLSIRDVVPSLGVAMFCLLMAPEFFGPLRRLAAHYHDRANALAAAAEVERVLGELPSAAGVGQAQGLNANAGMEAAMAASAGAAVRAHEDVNANANANAPATADMAEPAELAQHQFLDVSPVFRQKIGEKRTILHTNDALILHSVSLQPMGAPQPVLQGVNVRVQRGEWLALTGPSGSGKSTLLEAAAGWLAPQAGTLQRAAGLRVAYAGQRPYLFHGSLLDNLRLAKPSASESEVLAAAQAAQVLRFAQNLPQGLNTVIGERGFGLSGGEARRIGLARALLQDADVLLLDEPTAFLDPATESAVLQALGRVCQDRPTLGIVMATHSEAAIKSAQRVVDVSAWMGYKESA